MPISQREYVEFELDVLRRRLVDVEDGTRQVPPTEDGRAYRAQLREDIRELEERLASEQDDTISEPSTTTESPSCRRSSEAQSSDQEKESSALQQEQSSS